MRWRDRRWWPGPELQLLAAIAQGLTVMVALLVAVTLVFVVWFPIGAVLEYRRARRRPFQMQGVRYVDSDSPPPRGRDGGPTEGDGSA